MINVTKSYLPPLEEYVKYLEQIWASGWLTNHGPLVQELEAELAKFLNVPYVHFVSNGTIAIQIALRALEIDGEVITTPFSYVATSNSILWEHCQPVFVDIDSRTCCIDPQKIEAAITERTQAILPVHVYGYPADVEAIEKIADRHNLKVIYDAAHAFGCNLGERSILSYGDISTLSFHATKIFHSVEGGAIITHTKEMADRINKIKSFGHLGDEYFMLGVNGKNSEFHAAMGLCVLPHVDEIIQKRKRVCEVYSSELGDTNIIFTNNPKNYRHNYAYFPVLFRNEEQLQAVKKMLNMNGVNPRRYFYPSLNTLPFLEKKQPCPVSEDISSRVMCLPLYDSLQEDDVKRICGLVRAAMMAG